MYRVFIAEDEPAAMKHICTIIEIKCPGFEVVGTADNGRSALEQIEKLQPDVLITDVKMPVMDGITLVKRTGEKYPEILSVIISGYQDFDYAREALRSGVCDYILKPVKPSTFQERMRVIQGKLDEAYYVRRNRMIREMCRGILPDEKKFARFFPSSEYYVALFRKNGLPRRFVNSRGIEIFSIRDEQMMVYGRDEMEALYICPRELLFHNSFYQLMTHMAEKEKASAAYYTMVLREEAVPAIQLPEVIKMLYQTLDYSLIIGRKQVIVKEGQSLDEKANTGSGIWNPYLDRLEILVKDHAPNNKIQEEIKCCFMKWKEEGHTQLWVEDKVREMFGIFRRYHALDESIEMCEYFIDEAFYYAADMEGLADNIRQILGRSMTEEAKRIKIDTPEFFEKIVKYLREHLAEPLSPQDICEVFGISQTYLSRLFRKYSTMGFNKTLNLFRIEKAKEIMKDKSSLYIKDVAAMVGYGDQFYFSRIFRSVTGISPTEYMEKDGEESLI